MQPNRLAAKKSCSLITCISRGLEFHVGCETKWWLPSTVRCCGLCRQLRSLLRLWCWEYANVRSISFYVPKMRLQKLRSMLKVEVISRQHNPCCTVMRVKRIHFNKQQKHKSPMLKAPLWIQASRQVGQQLDGSRVLQGLSKASTKIAVVGVDQKESKSHQVTWFPWGICSDL